jgi:hypothetical protein
MTDAIFLSAGVPDPKRGPDYAKTADTVAITAAVSALVHVTLGAAPTVLLHEALHTLLADADALSMQFAPDARPAVSSAIGCIHCTNMHQQRLRAQVTTPSDLQPTNKVLVVARHTYPQHPALHTDRPHTPIASNQGVLHFCPLAKYAIAFPRMSRSILTRANSARKRLISICSAVTFDRLSTFQRAISMSLDPVEQRLLNNAQPARCSRDTLARLNKPNRFLFELQRVSRPRRLNHRYLLR